MTNEYDPFSVLQLVERLQDIKDKRRAYGFTNNDVALTTLRSRAPEGEKVRLFGRRGPLGEILNVKRENRRYSVTAIWDLDVVLDAMRDMLPGSDEQRK